jgi:hypothetical protein
VEGQGGCIETPIATMVVSSYVGDATLVPVVKSSSVCSWVCLDLFVAVKSNLQWRVPMAYDNWQHVVRSVIFYGASLAWFSFIALSQSRSDVVFLLVAKFWHWFSCCSALPLQCGLVQ